MRFLLVSAVAAIALVPTASQAYLNPDQGSILLQLLLGGLAGAGVLAKVYWHRLVTFFRRRPPDKR